MNQEVKSVTFKNFTVTIFERLAKRNGRDEISFVIRQRQPASERFVVENISLKAGQGDIVYRSPRKEKKAAK